jgi:carboxyl-terminal processing protease
MAAASFDSLWSVVSRTYVDTAFVGSRWVRVRDSLRPRAETITKRRELDALLADALHEIPDSHFYIIPAAVAPDEGSDRKSDGRGTTGLVVRVIGQRAVAWRVLPGSAADRARIRPGDIIAAVGERNSKSSLRKISVMPEKGRPRAIAELLQRFNGALTPSVGDTVHVRVERGGRETVHKLIAGRAAGKVSQYANLPPIAGVVKWDRIAVDGGGCVGSIAFNIWLPEFVPDIDRAVDSVRACRGVVIDLRGNPGGVGAMVMKFAGHFVDSARSLGTMRTRQVSLKFVINPQKSRDDGSLVAPIGGPVAILTDPLTASTSEIFASGMQRIGRARVFGERSAGAALPALMKRLPSGDVFVHAVADFTDPQGRRIEGAGTVPDVPVPLDVSVLAAGRDGPLEAAVRWISTEAGSGN